MACCARFLVGNGCIAIAAGQHACQVECDAPHLNVDTAR
jgi:hypothetical protein